MRFVRVAWNGHARWGLLRDEEVHVLAKDPFTAPETVAAIPLSGAHLLAPVEPSKIVALGRNFDAHRREMGYESNPNPAIFLKPPSAIIGPGEAVALPPRSVSNQVEHEAELAVVIGREARHVEASKALEYVFGYTCANDVSARDLQHADTSVTRGKGYDTFCPVGPWLETDVDLGQGLAISCRVNGERRQDGSTRDMVTDVPTFISYLSQFMTLFPGDLLLTGSPAGSGPLLPGDDVEIEISGIGTLRHTVK